MTLQTVVVAVFGGVFVATIRISSAAFVRATGDDLWEHSLAINSIKRGRRIPDSISEFHPYSEFYYPPVPYVLPALLNVEVASPRGVVLDGAVQGTLAMCMGLWVGVLTNSSISVMLGTVFYALNTVVAINSFTWSPRSLGAGLAGLGLIGLSAGPAPANWIIAGVIFGIAALTHRFASQGIWLLTLFMSIVLRDLRPMYAAVIGELLPLCLLSEMYLRIRRSHIQILEAYWRAFRERPSEPRLRVRTNVLRLAVHSLGLWCVIGLGLLRLAEGVSGSIAGNLAALSVGVVVVSLATSVFRSMLFLGEGERYLMISALPASVQLGILVTELGSKPGVVCGVLAVATQLAVWSVMVVRARRQSLLSGKHWIDQASIHIAASQISDAGLGGPFLCLPYALNRRFAYEGLKCFQLTPRAILGLPKLLGEHRYSTFLGNDLNDDTEALHIMVGRLQIAHVIVHGSYLVKHQVPRWDVALEEGDWVVYSTDGRCGGIGPGGT